MASAPAPDVPAATGAGPETKRRCDVFLRDLVEHSATMSFARIDAAEACLAFACKTSDDDAGAAAMSSQLALGGTSARAALRDDLAQSTIVTRSGIVMSIPIPSERGTYVVSIGVDFSSADDAASTPVLVLRCALDAAEKLASIIDAAA